MRGSNVQLVCDGDGWAGSFGLAVALFIDDILSDGEPFQAQLTWDEGDDVVTRVVTITSIQDGYVVTTGSAIRLSDILGLEA